MKNFWLFFKTLTPKNYQVFFETKIKYLVLHKKTNSSLKPKYKQKTDENWKKNYRNLISICTIFQKKN